MPEHTLPVHLTESLGNMKAKILSIYFTGDTPDVVLSDENTLVLTSGSSSLTIDLEGKSASQVAAMISRSTLGYTARVLFDLPDMGNQGMSVLSTQTLDGGTVLAANGHIIQALEETNLRLRDPYNDSRHDPWHVVVTKGWVTRQTTSGTWIYALPEYDNQTWSLRYGKGYIDIEDAVPERLGNKAFGVSRFPVLWDKNNITFTVNGTPQPTVLIKDVDVNNGIIYLNRDIPEGEHVLVSYTYKEDGYVYPAIDLNPTEFHNPAILDRYVLFYLLPYVTNDGVVRSSCLGYVERSTLLGAINSIPKDEPVLILGAAQVRYLVSSEDIQLLDTRSVGGGVKRARWEDALKRNREVLSATDYGFYDGRPYPGNMALFVTLPKELKETFERAEIEGIIKKFMAYGTYTFLEFE